MTNLIAQNIALRTGILALLFAMVAIVAYLAAAALASLPVVLVYIYLHKYMVGGLTAGAVKG